MMGVLARREQENFVKTPTELKASVNGAQCDASMVPATYRPLLCDSGQIGWRFFEILTPLNCPRKQPLS